jgi:hypothetical protein
MGAAVVGKLKVIIVMRMTDNGTIKVIVAGEGPEQLKT